MKLLIKLLIIAGLTACGGGSSSKKSGPDIRLPEDDEPAAASLFTLSQEKLNLQNNTNQPGLCITGATKINAKDLDIEKFYLVSEDQLKIVDLTAYAAKSSNAESISELCIFLQTDQLTSSTALLNRFTLKLELREISSGSHYHFDGKKVFVASEIKPASPAPIPTPDPEPLPAKPFKGTVNSISPCQVDRLSIPTRYSLQFHADRIAKFEIKKELFESSDSKCTKNPIAVQTFASMLDLQLKTSYEFSELASIKTSTYTPSTDELTAVLNRYQICKVSNWKTAVVTDLSTCKFDDRFPLGHGEGHSDELALALFEIEAFPITAMTVNGHYDPSLREQKLTLEGTIVTLQIVN